MTCALERASSPAGDISASYKAGFRAKVLLGLGLGLATLVLALLALVQGSYDLGPWEALKSLWGAGQGTNAVVVVGIRLPRVAAAIVTGWMLGLSGLATQTLLRNPLASPFTLGISHGAAFGAAFAIVFLGVGAGSSSSPAGGGSFFTGTYAVSFCGFLGAIAATVVILALARLKQMSSESLILAGVALSSLFVSGAILVQYFASETEIAAVVFWTFGDVARGSWREIALLAAAAVGVTFYFTLRRWDLNSLAAGEEVACGLGVSVERLRLAGMFLAALAAALATAVNGVIAFLGLLAPHIGRRLVGSDHRLLAPISGLVGALLLLLADTVGRVLLASGSLPVGVLTSFMGAPLFLYLLLKGRRP